MFKIALVVLVLASRFSQEDLKTGAVSPPEGLTTAAVESLAVPPPVDMCVGRINCKISRKAIAMQTTKYEERQQATQDKGNNNVRTAPNVATPNGTLAHKQTVNSVVTEKDPNGTVAGNHTVLIVTTHGEPNGYVLENQTTNTKVERKGTIHGQQVTRLTPRLVISFIVMSVRLFDRLFYQDALRIEKEIIVLKDQADKLYRTTDITIYNKLSGLPWLRLKPALPHHHMCTPPSLALKYVPFVGEKLLRSRHGRYNLSIEEVIINFHYKIGVVRCVVIAAVAGVTVSLMCMCLLWLHRRKTENGTTSAATFQRLEKRKNKNEKSSKNDTIIMITLKDSKGIVAEKSSIHTSLTLKDQNGRASTKATVESVITVQQSNGSVAGGQAVTKVITLKQPNSTLMNVTEQKGAVPNNETLRYIAKVIKVWLLLNQMEQRLITRRSMCVTTRKDSNGFLAGNQTVLSVNSPLLWYLTEPLLRSRLECLKTLITVPTKINNKKKISEISKSTANATRRNVITLKDSNGPPQKAESQSVV